MTEINKTNHEVPVYGPEVIAANAETGSLLHNPIQQLDAWRESHPYAATVAETFIVWAGKETVRRVADRTLGIKFGHGWQNSKFGQKFAAPAAAVAAGLAIAPLAEEIAFRKTPSDVLNKRGHTGLQARKGYAMATLFAAGHAGKDAIPMQQFVSGLNYWRLQRTRGARHAVLAHATNNTLSLAAGAHRARKQRKLHA